MTIVDEFHDLATPSGPMRTYVLRPAAPGRYPGVVFFSEVFQVTGPIRRAAAGLAGHGFVVAIPEIYHEFEAPGTALGYDEQGAATGNKHKIAKELAHYDADARAALDLLATHRACTGKLAVTGFCIGGHLAVRAALNPDVLAAAAFYATNIHNRALAIGCRADTIDRLGEIQGEIIMVWGRQDPHIPLEGRMEVYQALARANVNFQWHEFNGQHAFMRDEGPRFDPANARICYSMVNELFKRKLTSGDVVEPKPK